MNGVCVWGGGGFKDFGGISTVSIVLPADHASPRPSRMEAQNRERAQSETDSKARVKDFGVMSSVSIVDGAGLKPGGERKNHTGQIWNFCFRATHVYSIEGDREKGRISTDFVDCNRKRDSLLLGQCVCVRVCKQRSTLDVTHSSETCFCPKPGELMS